MRSRPFTGVLLVLALAMAISGCGGSDGEPDAEPTVATSTSPSSSPTSNRGGTPSTSTAAPRSVSPTAPVPKVNCRKAFSQKAAEALAGEKLRAPKSEAVFSLPGCRWYSTSTGAWVQAVAVPASQWAKAIPDAVESTLASDLEFEGREKLEEARRLIEAGGTLDDAAACGIFSTIASALQGQPAGTTRVISYVPSQAAPEAINEQACLRGRFYSVQLVAPELEPGPGLESKIKRALVTLSN